MATASFTTLPEFQKFDVNNEPSSLALEWEKWTARLENLFEALEITDNNRKRALMLFYAGTEVHEIYKTLAPTAPEEYDAAKGRLTSHFEPSRNETYEVYNFRSLSQNEDEPIDKYVVRRKEAAGRCGFTDRT